MAILSYKARAADGRTLSGCIEANTTRDAMRKLRERGIQVLSLSPAKGLRAALYARSQSLTRQRVKLKDLLALLSQLQLMVDAGTGLDTALTVLSEMTPNARLREVLEDSRRRIKEGESLSQALSKHPDVFDDLTVRMVAAGEASGTLSTMLETIRNIKERTAELRRSILTALAYPCVLLTVATIALCVLFIWVLPKFAKVFEEVGAELPGVTKFFLAVSHFIVDYKWMLLVSVLGIVIGLKAALGVERFRITLNRKLLALPLVGSMIRASNAARALHMMGTLWRSGLPIVEVTRLTGATLRNPLYRAFFDTLRQRLVDGKRLVASFTSTDLFPPTVAPLIRTGEETGKTPIVLESLADHHQKETAALVKTMITLLEPAVIVLMAGGVGLIAISVIVPLFRLSSAIH